MTNQQGAPEALRPIARYKIGYHSDEWGMCSSTPSGIPDASGSWVRYEDHAAELRRLHAYCQELESQVILDCLTHVQNHAEIEHVAGDVSKNGAELNNMSAQQPAPATQQAGWTNADADAARLALELECLLMDTKDTAVVSKWWQSANEALELHRARLQEAQPTPPAQTADSVLEDAGGANWQDISTAPKDGTRFVAVGQNYGLASEKQHTCIAQWLAGCWVEVSDWNGASKLKYLTHWMPLPPLPGSAARAPADSVLEDAARESEYRRGYRHGHNQRDAEVRGALA